MEKAYRKTLLLREMEIAFTDSILYKELWTVFLVLLPFAHLQATWSNSTSFSCT